MSGRGWKLVWSLGASVAVGGARPAGAFAQQVDPSVTRLTWGTLNILVMRDSVNGMGLWAAWSAAGERQGLEEDQFVAHYDPAAVRTWLDEVELLLLPDSVGAGSRAETLQTSPLVDLLGGRLFAVRLREGKRWSSRLYFSMSYSPREKPLQFGVDRKNATRLLEIVADAARTSHLTSAGDPAATPLYANPADPSTFPQGAGVRGVVYPQHLVDEKIEGDVWFSVVVDSTGRVRVDETLRVLLSDHPLLTQTARESLRDSKYEPARRMGRPVPIRIYQRVMYRIRDW